MLFSLPIEIGRLLLYIPIEMKLQYILNMNILHINILKITNKQEIKQVTLYESQKPKLNVKNYKKLSNWKLKSSDWPHRGDFTSES